MNKNCLWRRMFGKVMEINEPWERRYPVKMKTDQERNNRQSRNLLDV
jgi:hypothetical protein